MGLGITAWKFVTIADGAGGAGLSNALDITGMRVVAIHNPLNCEGVNFSFQVSHDGGVSFQDLFAVSEEQGVVATQEFAIPKSATVEAVIALPNTYWIYGYTHLKVRTGLTAAPTNQTGAATIFLGLEDVESVGS